jgi:probable rRNA maturation factor
MNDTSSSQPVRVFHACESPACPHQDIVRIAQRVYDGEHIGRKRCCNIICTGDRHIRELNARFRNIDAPTDILTFAFDEDTFLGEIYISLQRCDAQAPEYGLSYTGEVCRMVVHGLFHLLGYTHAAAHTQQEMERKEQAYLALI